MKQLELLEDVHNLYTDVTLHVFFSNESPFMWQYCVVITIVIDC